MVRKKPTFEDVFKVLEKGLKSIKKSRLVKDEVKNEIYSKFWEVQRLVSQKWRRDEIKKAHSQIKKTWYELLNLVNGYEGTVNYSISSLSNICVLSRIIPVMKTKGEFETFRKLLESQKGDFFIAVMDMLDNIYIEQPIE